MPTRTIAACALMLASVPAAAQAPAPGFFAALRDVDLRMATIAYRLTTANAALCDALAPTPGLAIHAIGQYAPDMRADARAAFGFAAPVAVEAVVPDSAAARAGIAADDAVIAVAGQIVAGKPGNTASSAQRDAVRALIAGQPAAQPLTLTLLRAGTRFDATVAASPGCRSAFEVLLGPGMEASADGDLVQIGSRFFERYDDAQVAVVVAHELAHNILHHARRLDAAGVKRGMLAEFGRNGRLFRRTENEADLLGMYLLRNAGYDPASAVTFWRMHGSDVDGGLFRSRTHPSSAARAQAIADEIARMPPNAPMPYVPPLLATRAAPLE
ncbi:MAG TPA: M48 family metallopeptidase [Sphingomonas sp.]|jgi:hypothetical protein|uniref:M48 family metallopeptidase n=1 Tax=Sphingomonas sp. TaxID=28214 RepID=UPI002ED94025